MKLLAEWKGSDWLKGQSAYVNLPIGGLFKSISNFDPFEQAGVVLPSLDPIKVPLATTPKFLTSFNYNNVDYIYVHTATKLYQVLKSAPYTVTDVTDQVNQGIANPVDRVYGTAKWKGSYVYAVGTAGGAGNQYEIHLNNLPASAGSDVVLKNTSVILDINQDFLPFCVGADGNLYYGSLNRLNVLTSPSGTSGNSSYYQIDNGFWIRDIVSDGKYLVIIADNNVQYGTKRVGSYQCKVFFWDMVLTDAVPYIIPVTKWDIEDSYLISAEFINGAVQIIGHNGIYICNVATSPKMLRPYPLDSIVQDRMNRPLNPAQVATHNGSLYWLDGVNTLATSGIYNPDVYAYGNPITGQQKIFYRPYTTNLFKLNTAMIWVGDQVVVATDEPALMIFNTGTARGTSVITTLITDMRLHNYGFIKVDLAAKMTAGQSVTVSAYSAGNNLTVSQETKSYNADNPKQTLMFRKTPVLISTSPDRFNDLEIIVRAVGAQIARVQLYGTPLNNASEDI